MKTKIAATLALMLGSQTAAAADRYSCVKGNDTPTTIEIDPTAKIFMFSENGDTKFDRLSICDTFGKILGDGVKGTSPRCSSAFTNDLVVADYVSTTGLNYVMTMIFDRRTMMLSSYVRVGDRGAYTDAAPCKRL
jgi:hypothetical protein